MTYELLGSPAWMASAEIFMAQVTALDWTITRARTWKDTFVKTFTVIYYKIELLYN